MPSICDFSNQTVILGVFELALASQNQCDAQLRTGVGVCFDSPNAAGEREGGIGVILGRHGGFPGLAHAQRFCLRVTLR